MIPITGQTQHPILCNQDVASAVKAATAHIGDIGFTLMKKITYYLPCASFIIA
jgi:hypothetical protein